MEATIFSTALRDFGRLKRLPIWILLGAAVFIITRVFFMLPHESVDSIYVNISGVIIFRLLALVSAILATAIVSAEVDQKTIVYLLTRPIPRWKLILFRTLAAIVVSAVTGLFFGACASFAAYGPNLAANPYFLRDVKGLIIGAAAYTSLFVFITLLMQKSMVALIFYAFIFELIASRIPGDLKKFSIGAHLEAIAERPSIGMGGGAGEIPNTLSASSSLPAMIGLIVCSLACAAWWFSTFEYIPREDGE